MFYAKLSRESDCSRRGKKPRLTFLSSSEYLTEAYYPLQPLTFEKIFKRSCAPVKRLVSRFLSGDNRETRFPPRFSRPRRLRSRKLVIIDTNISARVRPGVAAYHVSHVSSRDKEKPSSEFTDSVAQD